MNLWKLTGFFINDSKQIFLSQNSWSMIRSECRICFVRRGSNLFWSQDSWSRYDTNPWMDSQNESMFLRISYMIPASLILIQGFFQLLNQKQGSILYETEGPRWEDWNHIILHLIKSTRTVCIKWNWRAPLKGCDIMLHIDMLCYTSSFCILLI